MTLKLIPPGHRDNKYWSVYGRYGGKVIEKSTGQQTRPAAAAWLERWIGEQPKPPPPIVQASTSARAGAASGRARPLPVVFLTVALPPALLTALRRRAAARHIGLQRLIGQLLEHGLQDFRDNQRLPRSGFSRRNSAIRKIYSR